MKQIHPLASQAQPQESQLDPISPATVWTTLTLTQQHHVLQTLVLMCQDCLLPGKETGYDPACPFVENYTDPS